MASRPLERAKTELAETKSKIADVTNDAISKRTTKLSPKDLKDPNCDICSSRFHHGDTPESPLKIVRCGHIFGSQCLSKWLFPTSAPFSELIKDTCPMCRAPVLGGEVKTIGHMKILRHQERSATNRVAFLKIQVALEECEKERCRRESSEQKQYRAPNTPCFPIGKHDIRYFHRTPFAITTVTTNGVAPDFYCPLLAVEANTILLTLWRNLVTWLKHSPAQSLAGRYQLIEWFFSLHSAACVWLVRWETEEDNDKFRALMALCPEIFAPLGALIDWPNPRIFDSRQLLLMPAERDVSFRKMLAMEDEAYEIMRRSRR